MFDRLLISSHQGPYEVACFSKLEDCLAASDWTNTCWIVDENVARLYQRHLEPRLASNRHILIRAAEDTKSLERLPEIIDKLLECGIRRGQQLIAVGGGIVQDITCFLAATLFRGLEWRFIPTTLLAQTDSCVGSKSSINCGSTKNLVGTFTPPKQIFICSDFLQTLSCAEMMSGVGEMLKINAIDGPQSFARIAADYEALFQDDAILQRHIYNALLLKKRFIEVDEFDTGVRNVLNYGHSFGHAIESATNYQIPHGIAVTIGMDMANFVAFQAGIAPAIHFSRLHTTLKKNYQAQLHIPIDLQTFFSALSKDKKNEGAHMLSLILPHADGVPQKTRMPFDNAFRETCKKYFALKENSHDYAHAI